MRSSLTALVALLATSAFVAASPHDSTALFARHAKIASRDITHLKRADNQRCKSRTPPPSLPKEEDKKTESKNDGKNSGSNNNSNNNNNTNNNSGSNYSGSKHPSSVSFNPNGGSYAGSCTDKHATKEITRVSGPNGGQDWFNCGIEGKGWNPPFLGVNDLVTVPLDVAIKQDGSPFKACSEYVGIFKEMEKELGIPAIFFASFAMQESSCNKNTVGQGGEQGLMQITRDKCGGKSDAACREPYFNISTGARYFAGRLKASGGNVLLAVAQYNGWYEGLTESKARAARWSGCCMCQNNLDYLMNWANGWLLNFNVYNSAHRLGKYNNLGDCFN